MATKKISKLVSSEIEKEEGKKVNIIELSKEPDADSKWFVIHTYSGHEEKVANTLLQRVQSVGLGSQISKILIPTQEKIVISEGKKRKVDERLFPGYVIVFMKMTDPNWYVVRSTPGVTGFVGAGSKPTPLAESEVATIQKFSKIEAPRYESRFKVDDAVKITDGVFLDCIGKIIDVNEDQGKVKVLVSVFGRETPVELDFLQISSL
ncbi:transcription termination/antitermination protein NusG [Candidatus Parcubacteria bacterium]|nr:transcription termination/antitermination protein NusG [Patescibacteria group bacterium]MBU4380936.1 transcription termination/antitermination protein NusG [Patescibacteria group bacterium]MCG2689454.1 transcription termination/antitermination protein NusG [Candidatus Parcubacteria bacterium]